MLVRRQVYFDLGGHAAVASAICEDRALALGAQSSGYQVRVLAAEHLASTRMYRDLPSLWEGLSKNALEILGSSGLTLAAAAAGMAIGWAALALPAVIAVAIFPQPAAIECVGLALAVAGSAIVVGVQLGTARHFRIPAIFGILLPCGYTAAFLLACHSLLLHRAGGVTWKGGNTTSIGSLRRQGRDASDRDAGRASGPSSGMSGGATPGPRRSRVGGWPIAAVLAVLALLLYEIRVALLPFIFAVAVAFVLDPLIKRLQRRLGARAGRWRRRSICWFWRSWVLSDTGSAPPRRAA